MLQKLFEMHNLVISQKKRSIKRYLYEKINWNLRAICIFGARGTGKTTLLVQYYDEHYDTPEKALYISADYLSVIAHGLYEVADTYFKSGGEVLLIDEIHKYPNWSAELKNIIDVYSEKQIIISGSSSLNLQQGKGDLSRRVVYYELQGLSFREFLVFETGIAFQTLTLEDIFSHHIKHASIIQSKTTILKQFNNYLLYGYYPFFLEGKNEYFSRINNVIEKVISDDIATLFNVKRSNISKIKKLLWLIGVSQPFTPNIDNISNALGISRDSVYNYIEYLQKSGLIIAVGKSGKGSRVVRKPAKIYMENTGLIKTVSEITGIESLIGSMRETFFANQLHQISSLTVPKKGDFMVNNDYIVEVGGKNKTFAQIRNEKNAFLALDGIEVGFGDEIPLYLFGFTY